MINKLIFHNMQAIVRTPILFHFTRWSAVQRLIVFTFVWIWMNLQQNKQWGTRTPQFNHFRKVKFSKKIKTTLVSNRSGWESCFRRKLTLVVPEDVLSSIFSNKQERGEKKLYEFLKSRLWNKRIAISDTVSKNGVQFFCMETS